MRLNKCFVVLVQAGTSFRCLFKNYIDKVIDNTTNLTRGVPAPIYVQKAQLKILKFH